MPRIYTLATSEVWGTGTEARVDSTLSDFHRYFPSYYSGRAHLGVLGLRGYSLLERPLTGYLDYGFGPYQWYDKRDADVRYYEVVKPFSRAFYTSGPQNEQFLDFEHAQRIRPDWYAAMDFRVSGTDGIYTRQKTGYTHLQLNSNYRTKDKRYGIHGNFLMNRLNSEENGGLVSDTTFELPTNINREGGAVNIGG